MTTNNTNQPTTVDPTVFPNYISIRITTPHDEWPKVVSNVLHDRSYIAYPHVGKGGTNPHYHLFVPSDNLARDAECLRNRVKRTFGGGNKTLSVVQKSNGIMSAVQYGSREGSMPIVSDEHMQGIVDRSPPWQEAVKTAQTMLPLSEKRPKPECDWSLTYSNLVTQAVKYARMKQLTGSLRETVQDMCENTKWKPSFHMVKNGVPDHYYKDYEFRVGKRQKFDMDWMTPKF